MQETESMMNIKLAMFKTVMAYVITEYLGGHADTVKVTMDGDVVSISDNGRGHAVDNTLNGIPYLEIVYGQLSLFDRNPNMNAFQLHALGMSLFSEMCESIHLTVAKNGVIREYGISNGTVTRISECADPSSTHGNTIEYRPGKDISGEFSKNDLLETLHTISSRFPGLTILFNDQPV